jgi:hypothetical protein
VDGKIVAVAALQVHYFFDSSPQRHAINPDWVEVSLLSLSSLSVHPGTHVFFEWLA